MAKQRINKATMKKATGGMALFALVAALSFLVVQLLRRRQATPAQAPVTSAPQMAPNQTPTPVGASRQNTSERESSKSASRPAATMQNSVAAPARHDAPRQAPVAPPPAPATEDEVRETVLAVLEADEGIPTTSLEAAFVEAIQEADTSEATVSEPEISTNQPFVGNLRTLIYHPAHSAHLPSPDNSRFFASEEEAIEAGFRRAEGE